MSETAVVWPRSNVWPRSAVSETAVVWPRSNVRDSGCMAKV